MREASKLEALSAHPCPNACAEADEERGSGSAADADGPSLSGDGLHGAISAAAEKTVLSGMRLRS